MKNIKRLLPIVIAVAVVVWVLMTARPEFGYLPR